MRKRRTVLKGTTAASIAAVAVARGLVSPLGADAFVLDGATSKLDGRIKQGRGTIDAFWKYRTSGAPSKAVFIKVDKDANDLVHVFLKIKGQFLSTRDCVTTLAGSLDHANAAFLKLHQSGSELLVTDELGKTLVVDAYNSAEGPDVSMNGTAFDPGQCVSE